MTVLVLDPAAQGLEPRIVRGILERLEQARSRTCGSFQCVFFVCLLVCGATCVLHGFAFQDQQLCAPGIVQHMLRLQV